MIRTVTPLDLLGRADASNPAMLAPCSDEADGDVIRRAVLDGRAKRLRDELRVRPAE